MDDLDRQIVGELRDNARATNAEIGESTGLSESAVRRRIARLRSEGTILKFTVVTVPLGPEGWVLVRCRPTETRRIVEDLRRTASEVFETSGEFDLGALVERSTMEELNLELDRIRSLSGVEATLTLIRLTRSVRAPARREMTPARARPRPSSDGRAAPSPPKAGGHGPRRAIPSIPRHRG